RRVGRDDGTGGRKGAVPGLVRRRPGAVAKDPWLNVWMPTSNSTGREARGYGRLVDGIFRPSGASCRRALAAAETDPARHAAGNKRPARRAGGLAALPADAKVARGWRRLPGLDG